MLACDSNLKQPLPQAAIVAQLGSRMRYAVPRILRSAGALKLLYTDFCAGSRLAWCAAHVPARVQPGFLQRLAGRRADGIPLEQVRSFNAFGVHYRLRLLRAKCRSERTAAHLWAGREFCRRVVDSGLRDAGLLYGYNSAALELLEEAHRRSALAVVEQTIAARDVEDQVLTEEWSRFPEWEPPVSADTFSREYAARERAEWAAADLVVCGSEYVKDSVIHCGGQPERCVVVPYGIETGLFPAIQRSAHSPLRVLTVGTVGLRKGIPYLIECAKRLRGRALFRVVGPIELTPTAARTAANQVELTGPVARTAIGEHYEWADVFLLPSLCEGSATVCYEALSAGLPVITTPNAGSVIRDGQDGFIVPIRDVDAITERLERLITAPGLLREMSRCATGRAGDFTLERYGARLLNALSEAARNRNQMKRRAGSLDAG